MDLSAFFLDVLKDRLYTCKAGSRERRAAQTAIYHILDRLVRLMAPILSFTSEEAWSFMPGRKEASVHLAQMPEPGPSWIDDGLEKKWETIATVKAEATKALETARQQKIIGHSLDASVTVYPPDAMRPLLEDECAVLEDILIISGFALGNAGEAAVAEGRVTYESKDIEGLRIIVEAAGGTKCERCWHYRDQVGEC